MYWNKQGVLGMWPSDLSMPIPCKLRGNHLGCYKDPESSCFLIPTSICTAGIEITANDC